MDRLRSRLKGDDGAAFSVDQVRAWLGAAGFVQTPREDVWLAEEVSLDALADDEILAKKVYA